MRVRIHFVAVLLVALLTAEPAVAGLYCPMDRADGSVCAQMAEMSVDCPMHGQHSQEVCAPDCCNQAQPSSVAAMSSAAAKPRLALHSTRVSVVLSQDEPREASAGFEPPAVRSGSLSRHILLRVLRI
jgi:hypothetical protein